MQHKQSWTDEEYETLARLWATEMKREQIGRAMGRTASAIKAAAHRCGLPSRRNGGELQDADAPPPPVEPGFPKTKPCIAGCGRKLILRSRNDHRKCEACHRSHAELSHLEGVDAWAA